MAKYLIIVESPTKVKTIKKFLGSNYDVAASNGHVRDMPKSQLGFDVENNYEPKYITIRGKGDILAALRKSVKKSDKVYLATDPDREGEAISWHLSKALKLEEKDIHRITFNEITKTAVKESLKTFARNVAYRTIRMTGVIIDVNNIPLSLKNSFLFLFINANTVLINAHLQAFSL